MHVATSAVAEVWPVFAVVAHGDTRSVVLGHKDGAAIVAKIVLKRVPAHRSDASVSELSDLDAMALPGGTYLIRTAQNYRQTAGIQLGTCPPRVVRSIQDALLRERDGLAMEAKYRLRGPSKVLATGCRQIGAKRAP